MPYLDPPQIYYECLKDKKHDKVKVKILQMYVLHLENSYYPMDEVYPTNR